MGFYMCKCFTINNLIMEIMYIIALISTTWYGVELLLDITKNRELNAHIGYGLISIMSLWQIIPALSIGILIIFTIYIFLIIGIWIEKLKND